MKLSQICIDKPVLATVISLVLLLFGLVGYSFLHVRYTPKTFTPGMSVEVSYPGASAQLMEQDVADKVENALSDTAYLKVISSQSTKGSTNINLEFYDITEQKFLSVQSNVIRELSSLNNLPQGADKPIIYSHGGNGNFVMVYSFYDPNMSSVELTSYIHDNIAKVLRRIPGMGSVDVQNLDAALRIAVDPKKLSALGLTIGDVKSALSSQNVSFSVGSIISKTQDIPISAQTNLDSISAFNNILIKKDGDRMVRLKDVATVSMGARQADAGYVNIDGHPGAGLAINAAENANPIAVGNQVRQTMSELKPFLPPGMHANVVFDLTQDLSQAVKEVFKTILGAVILVSLVVLLTIGRIRSAVIPIVTIPVCLIATFGIMYLLGFSLNILTLMALVLAVGLVVDDAIVVMENSHRHIEAGMAPKAAAKRSMKEITFAIIGMTVCLLAVYAPTAFMQGATATKFQAFAFTLAASVLISGFVALTLTPMMCSKLLKRHKLSGYEQFLDNMFASLRSGYQIALGWVLRCKWLVVIVFVLLIGLGIRLVAGLPTALMPSNPAAAIFAMMQGPATANSDYTRKLVKPVLAKAESLPDIKHISHFQAGKSNASGLFMGLKEWDKLQNPAQYSAEQINKAIKDTPGITGGAFVMDLNHHNNYASGVQMEFKVLGMTSYNDISQAADNLADKLKASKVFTTVKNKLKFDSLEYKLTIDQNLATLLNVSIDDIRDTLNTMLGGPELSSQFKAGERSYPIVMQLPSQELNDFNVLEHVHVKNSNGDLVALSRFVHAKPILSLATREHYNQMRAGTVGVNIADGYTRGQAIATIKAIAAATLPAGMHVAFAQQAKQMLQNNQDMLLIFMLGIVFIYLVLAALFESFIDPLIVLLTVPLCIVGALLALKLIGASLNIFTGIGLVTLIGLVAKHGILITEFANQLQAQGVKLYQAVIQAATIRLRPVLMTTLTMALGALPLVLGAGPGSIGRSQIGWVIIAGLLVGTFFSLFVVPVAYVLLARQR